MFGQKVVPQVNRHLGAGADGEEAGRLALNEAERGAAVSGRGKDDQVWTGS